MKIFIKYSIIVLFFLTSNVYSSDEKVGRSFVDIADIDDGYNIHVMYVIPIDGVDKAVSYTHLTQPTICSV